MTGEFNEMLIPGNPQVTRFVGECLERFADGDNVLLREMSEEVLQGRSTLRQIAMTNVYGNELGAAFEQFTDYYRNASQAERDRAEHAALEYLEQIERGVPAGPVLSVAQWTDPDQRHADPVAQEGDWSRPDTDYFS